MGIEAQLWMLRAIIAAAIVAIVLAWRRDRRNQATIARITADDAAWARRDLDSTELEALRPPGRGRPVLRTGQVLERPAARR